MGAPGGATPAGREEEQADPQSHDGFAEVDDGLAVAELAQHSIGILCRRRRQAHSPSRVSSAQGKVMRTAVGVALSPRRLVASGPAACPRGA